MNNYSFDPCYLTMSSLKVGSDTTLQNIEIFPGPLANLRILRLYNTKKENRLNYFLPTTKNTMK